MYSIFRIFFSYRRLIHFSIFCRLNFMMDPKQPNKKLRLSTGGSKNYFGNRRNSPEKKTPYTTKDDDDDLWGEEINVDDEEIQRIETQGYSQYHGNVCPLFRWLSFVVLIVLTCCSLLYAPEPAKARVTSEYWNWEGSRRMYVSCHSS